MSKFHGFVILQTINRPTRASYDVFTRCLLLSCTIQRRSNYLTGDTTATDDPLQAQHTKGTPAVTMEGWLLKYSQRNKPKEDRGGRPENEMRLCTIRNLCMFSLLNSKFHVNNLGKVHTFNVQSSLVNVPTLVN